MGLNCLKCSKMKMFKMINKKRHIRSTGKGVHVHFTIIFLTLCYYLSTFSKILNHVGKQEEDSLHP